MTGHPYSPALMERFRRPRNRGSLRHPTITEEGSNPLCGDRVRFDMLLEGERVRDARFSANACAICSASADQLADLVRNAYLDEVETLTVQDLLNALKATIPQARMNCLRLPLTVMHVAIKRYREQGKEGASTRGADP